MRTASNPKRWGNTWRNSQPAIGSSSYSAAGSRSRIRTVSASVRRYSAGSIPSAARVTFSLNSGGNDSSVPDRATQSPAKSNTPAATWAEQFQRAAQSLPTTRM